MHARALPSVPGHVPIWANFVVYGPILKILLEIAQLGSALLGRLPEATALEPVKLPLILSGVCSLSSANYFPNPFGIIYYI